MKYLLAGFVILVGVGAVYWFSESGDNIQLVGGAELYLDETLAEYEPQERKVYEPYVSQTDMRSYAERQADEKLERQRELLALEIVKARRQYNWPTSYVTGMAIYRNCYDEYGRPC